MVMAERSSPTGSGGSEVSSVAWDVSGAVAGADVMDVSGMVSGVVSTGERAQPVSRTRQRSSAIDRKKITSRKFYHSPAPKSNRQKPPPKRGPGSHRTWPMRYQRASKTMTMGI